MIKEKIKTGYVGSEAKSFTIRVVEPQPPEETRNILLLLAAAAIGLVAIWTYIKRK